MEKYKTTVGLEVHAELKTNSKMFCACANDPYHGGPNEHVCPVCMGHPGTLPVINKEAVRSVLRVGVALGGEIADFTEFDRKNYFYPDIPKGYQISQYKYPLVKGGELAGVKITRIHLEEDTGTSAHGEDNSLLDFNRAGVPLMELVTEPVINSATDAGNFARELQLLLRTLGVSEANMEKGEMRVEANISVSANDKLGTKVEVKNLNSFKSVEKAIEYETKRHIELIEKGEKVIQETRGWDENAMKTFSQRKKEESHDYRYFPDPDLPKLKLSEIEGFAHSDLKESLPELPWQKRKRYINIGLNKEQFDIFVVNKDLGKLFESTINSLGVNSDKRSVILLANYICSDVVGLAKKFGEEKMSKATPEGLSYIVGGLLSDKLSSRGAKDALAEVFEKGGDLIEIAKKHLQKNDPEALNKIVEEVIKNNEKAVEEYKNGKESSLQFLVGQGMKLGKGSLNPNTLRDTIIKKLIKN